MAARNADTPLWYSGGIVNIDGTVKRYYDMTVMCNTVI